jgi:hypothetical protein
MRRPNEAMRDEWMAVSVIAGELLILAKAHPKKALLVLLFHIWVYGLAIHHIQELRSLYELIPFTN